MVSDILITLILAPILIPQIFYTKITTLKLKEAIGERSGVSGNGRPLKLLILGDSAAAGVGVIHQDEALAGQLIQILTKNFTVDWRLQAKSGINTASAINHLEKLEPLEVDIILVSLGVNDITSLIRQGEWLKQLDKLRYLLLSKFKAKHILFSSLPPMHVFPSLPQPLRWFLGKRAKRFNQTLLEYSLLHEQFELIALDIPMGLEFIAEDGFHPSAKAYKLWSELAAKIIKKIYKS